MSLSYTKLVGRDASFQLLRTNPKLTSNIKLVVDGSDNLYLNSIPADTELAKDQYQKYSVDITKSHEFNVFNFYNKGKTPSKIAFKLGSTITQTVTARDLKNQFDFDFYTSGAKYLKSKQYNEKFAYFAPLYLNRIIPDTFVIFKVKGPSNYSAGAQVGQTGSETIRFSSQVTQSAIDEYLQNQSDLSLRREFFRNFQLVKAFDLKPETKIGAYLERIIENPMFPTSPLAINFNSKGFSYYRGLSIKSGTYVELPVDTNSVLTRSLPLLKKEQFIINGFQDNSIIHPNILNLEFVFDDDTAEDFEFNRYFGVYCNRIDLAEFELDLDATFENPNDNQQSLTVKYTNDEDIVLPVTNPAGVRVRAKNISTDVTDLKNAMATDNKLFFTYVETKSDIHLVKPFSWNQQNAFADFQIDDPSVDLGTFFGPGEIFSQEPAVSSKLPSRSTLAVKVLSTPTNVSSFKLYHTNGTYTDSIGKYDPLTFVLSSAATAGSFAFNAPGKWSVEYLANGQTVIYVSADGDTQDIAAAITGAVNDLTQSDIQAVAVDNFAFIQIKAFGESVGQLKAHSANSALKLIGTAIDGLTYADGGTINPYPIIDNNQVTEDTLPLIKIEENKEQLIVKTQTNWSRISRVSRPTSLISPLQTSETLTQGKSDFLSKATIILKDNEVPYIAHGNIEIRKIAKNKVGVLSIFDIKDFDFGITKTDYARFDKIDLFKDFYEPANVPALDFRKYVYRVIGTGKIILNEIVYNSGDYIWQDRNNLQLYSIVEGDCAVIKTSISPNAFIRLDQYSNPLAFLDLATVSVDDDELKEYTGQFSIRTPFVSGLDELDTKYTELSEYRNRYLTGVVSSEYLVYKEEQSTEFSIDNKITPYISKWGLKDSTDCRSNPYRLNADLLFGKDNFGPSHTEVLPVSEKLTHEWFYIESDFGFNLVPETMYQNYSYFEEKFNFSRFVTEAGYFDEYFNYVPSVDGNQIDRVQLRYSDLFKDPYSNQYETVFKGVKYRFFELDQALLAQTDSTDSSLKTNTDRFKDYRFSALLIPIEDPFDQPQTPARFEIIENTDAKAIVVLIYVALASNEFLNPGVRERVINTLEPKVFNQTELLSITPAGNILFTELYGDYRVQYNQYGVSNLTHSFLYYAKSKKYNSGQNSYSTTRLAKNIDLSFTGFQSDVATNSSSSIALNIPVGSGYDVPVESQIAILQGQYSPLVMFKPTGQNFESQIIVISNSGTDLVTVATNPILSVSQDVVQYTDSDMYAIEVLNTGTLNQNLLSQLPLGSQDQWRSLYYTYQINGGASYYEKLFQYFSFANFKFLLDSKESVITWKSFTGGNLATTQQFTIRAVDPSPISISTVLVNVEQKVTSNSRSLTGGYSYDESAVIPTEIHRYSGEYDVIFRPISAFYQNLKINNFTISGANCSLHIHVPNFFVVPEFYHVKYSKSQLLDLENSTAYSPIYPTINETPIGVAPYNILNSSWDRDYHFEYVDKSTYTKIFGTRRITEDYAFVSKLINVPESLHLDEFYISQVNQAQFRSMSFSNMVEYADYAKNIRFKIDFARAAAVGFKNKGLYAEFAKFFSDQNGTTITSSIPLLGELTLDQYTEEYAKANLQSLYKVDEVEIWQKFDKTIPNGTVVLVSKTLDQFINEGYTQTKNVRINNQNPTVLEGAIDKPINSGVYVGFRIKIKFI